MEEITAEQVTLKCVDALELLSESTPTVAQLADGKFFARLITILKNKDVQNNDLVSNIPTLEAIVKEHFAGPDLVNFEEIAAGNHLELTKLTLLLMYIMIFVDGKLRSKLISSPVMDQSTQVKFKYLIESIQRRGSGMSTKFLNILCTERLDGKVSARCQTPVSGNAPWGSPNIYSSSPKAAPTSPLRDLVQSPPFRMQKLLNAKTKEVKQMQQQIHNLENEKQETEVNMVLLHKKIAKLSDDLEKCHATVKEHKQYRDDLEAKLMAGDDLVQQQMHRLAKESSLLRTENASLQDTINRLLESNDELSTKNESLHRRHLLVTAERDRLEEEISTLSRAGLENQSIIETQSCLLKDLRNQLEELQQCLLENNRPTNRTIEESFEGGSPMNFYDTASPANASSSGGNVSGENMADAIVDKILGETQDQLTKLQAQHAALQEKLVETTCNRDQILEQVEALTMENDTLNAELGDVKENYSQLTVQHTELQEKNKVTLINLQELKVKCTEIEGERSSLQNQLQDSQVSILTLREQLNQQMRILSEKNIQLEDVEGRLHQATQELQCTAASLREVTDAKNALQEEFSRTVSRMDEDFRMQKANMTEEHEKKVEELNSNLSLLMAEWDTLTQEKNILKQEIQNNEENYASGKSLLENKVAQMEEKLSLLTVTLKEKENELTEQLDNFNKQMDCINAEKVIYEGKVAEVCAQINEMESQHAATLNGLKCEAEKQQNEFDNTVSDLQNKIKELHAEKLHISNEREEQMAAVKSLALEVESKQNCLSKVEKERQEIFDTFEQEKAAMTSIIKAQEEALDSLKQQIEGALQDHNKEKATLEEEINEKQITIATVRQDLENAKLTHNEEKTKLEQDIEIMNKTIADQQQQVEQLAKQFNEEKASLYEKIEQKELAISGLKQEMDMTVTSVINEKNLEIQKKEEALRTLQQEQEHYVKLLSDEKGSMAEIISAKEEALLALQKQMQEEKMSMSQVINEKEINISSLENKIKEAAVAFDQEKMAMNEIVKSKEAELSSLQSKLDEEKETMTSIIKSKGEEILSLQQVMEHTVQSIEKQKMVLESEFKAKEGSFTLRIEEINNEKILLTKMVEEKEEALNLKEQEMQEALNMYNQEKIKLNDVLKSKEESLMLLEKKMQEETLALSEMVQMKEETLSSLQEKMQEASETYDKGNAALLQELMLNKEKLVQFEQENEKIRNVMDTEILRLSELLQQKEDFINEMKEKMKELEENHNLSMQRLQTEFEDVSAARDSQLLVSEELNKEISSLKDQILSKDAEYKQNLTEKDGEMMKEIMNLKECLSEKQCSLENLEKENGEQQQKHNSEVEALKLTLNENVALVETLKIEKLQLEQKMSEEVKDFQLKQETYQKEKEEQDKRNKEQITSLNNIINEKLQLLESMEEKQQHLHTEHECMQAEWEKKLSDVKETESAKVASLLTQLEEKSEEILLVRNELEQVQEEKKSLMQNIQMKEDAFSSLKQDMEETVKTLKMEKDEVLTKTKQDKETLLAELSQEKSSLTQGLYEKDEAMLLLKQEKQSLTELKEQLASQVQKLEESLLEKNQALETLHAEAEENQKHKLEILTLQANLCEMKKQIESLEEEKSLKTQTLLEELESVKNDLDSLKKEKDEQKKSSEEQMASLNAVLSEKSVMLESLVKELKQSKTSYENLRCQMEKEISELTEREGQKIAELKNQSEEEHKRMLVVKQELELVRSSSEIQKEELAKQEKAAREAAESELREKIESIEEEKVQMLKDREDFERTMLARIASLESDVKSKETTLSAQTQEIEAARLNVEKYKAQALTLEAKLIDKEQEVTSTKEEIMRVEREGERSTRSLKEELKAIKEKSRAERQAEVDKMKASYKTEAEKLMVQIEEQEKVLKERQIIHQKYEQAKKKLSEVMTELNESRMSEEHYQKQVTKYKEHVGKLNEGLQTERRKQSELVEKIKELEEKNLPLKEKLHESELTIRRLGNEKRTLEAQVKLADSKMREMNKQWERESFGFPGKSLSRAPVSESRLSDLHLARPSSSSTEEESINDSNHLLLPKTTRARAKEMARAISTDGVFRKPTRQNSTLERQPKSSVDIANLAAAASTGKKKITPSLEKAMSERSLGHSVPRDMLFNCEDEEELFSNKYLIDMQVGKCSTLDDPHLKRLSELQRRNSLYPPHMRSAYPAEMQFRPLQDFDDDKLRAGHAVEDRQLWNLTQATENLGLDSPAFNLRKRKSLSDSTTSETSLDSSGGKRSKRLSTSYSRPGPPTPGRKSLSRADKENRNDNTSPVSTTSRGSKVSPKSAYSESGSPVSTRYRRRTAARAHSPGTISTSSARTPGRSSHSGRSPANVSVLSKKGVTPRGKRGLTPSSLRKILSKGKSPWRKLESESEISGKPPRPERLVNRLNRAIKLNR